MPFLRRFFYPRIIARIHACVLAWMLLTLAACSPAPASAPIAGTIPPRENLTPSLAISRAAPETTPPGMTPTAQVDEIELRTMTISTPDGAVLEGNLYGNGTTAIIFSHMSDSRQQSWEGMAQATVRQGYLALTYDFRFWSDRTNWNSLRGKAGEDLLAAIEFVRQQGARDVVLVGASLGGLASAEAALVEKPAAVVILSAPLDWPDWPSLTVTEQDIQAIQAPVLFINSERDRFVEDTERMFAVASEPKEMQIYLGAAHGTQLLSRENGPQVVERILTFIRTYAPNESSP